MSGEFVAFLYLLMRDTIPCGEVARLVANAETVKDGAIFTNKHLEAYAREIAMLLMKEK